MTSGPFDAATVPDAYQRYLVPAIFRPWAEVLLDHAGVGAGGVVVDVASGTGVVASAAVDRVGPTGRVVATDVSPAMLALAGRMNPSIETVVSAAAELQVDRGAFDVAVCQQGFQFIDDRVAAATGMRRALRVGGTAAIAVWLQGPLLEPFDVYGQVLESEGIPEPFPRAYAYDFSMSTEEVIDVLSTAGFGDIEVDTKVVEISWASTEEAVRGLAGTPYGPAVASLDSHRQGRIADVLRERLRPTHPMTAVLGRARAT